MNILVIGCGYVGSATAKFWQQKGHNLTVTTTTPAKVSSLQKIANQVLILNTNNLELLEFATQNQDLILLSIAPSQGQSYEDTYLVTAENLVKILANNQTVKQLIYTSSYGILGDRQGKWSDETAIVKPSNQKQSILVETEQVLLTANFANKIKVSLLRLAGIYGPLREIKKIFQRWCGTTRSGFGLEYSNWVHLEDIVRAIAFLAENQLEGIYHLADDTPRKRKDLLDKMCEIHGLPKVNWDHSLEGLKTSNLRLSNQKIKNAGFTFLHPRTEI
jgi:nucleoside-diphosphate-sugar epimerase